MPTNEKEYNGYLFDQLSLIEDIERVAKKTNSTEVLELLDIKRKQIERKLYQSPPLVEEKQEEMVETMTDKQYDGILQMIGMILEGCKDLEEAKKKIAELREGKSTE